jgi:hypothetical protein
VVVEGARGLYYGGSSSSNRNKTQPSYLLVLHFKSYLMEPLVELAYTTNSVKGSCADHHPIRIGDERERLVTASPLMKKSRAPAGETITRRTAS